MRALRAQGLAPLRIDARASAASANAAALVAPRLDAGLGAAARLHAEAFARAVALYEEEAPDAVIARGALQLAHRTPDADRFARLAGWDGFAPGTVRLLTPDAAAARLDEAAAPAALALDLARVVDPGDVLARWLGAEPAGRGGGGADRPRPRRAPSFCRAPAARRSSAATRWCWRAARAWPRCCRSSTCGRPAARWPCPRSPSPARPPPGPAYALPTRGGLLFGATHGRDDADAAVRPGDEAANLRALASGRPALAARLRGAPLHGPRRRAARRTRSPAAGGPRRRPRRRVGRSAR